MSIVAFGPKQRIAILTGRKTSEGKSLSNFLTYRLAFFNNICWFFHIRVFFHNRAFIEHLQTTFSEKHLPNRNSNGPEDARKCKKSLSFCWDSNFSFSKTNGWNSSIMVWSHTFPPVTIWSQTNQNTQRRSANRRLWCCW